MKKTIGMLMAAALVAVLFAQPAMAQRDQQQRDDAKSKQQDPKQQRRGRGMRRGRQSDDAPKVGDFAPTFTLNSMDGKSETNLAEFKGVKPVVLCRRNGPNNGRPTEAYSTTSASQSKPRCAAVRKPSRMRRTIAGCSSVHSSRPFRNRR